MARTISTLRLDRSIVTVRIASGSPLAADSSTLTDANFPEALDPDTGGAIDCSELATVWVGADLFNGATQVTDGSATVVLDMLVRDATAADGHRWKRPLFGAQGNSLVLFQPTLDGTGLVQMRVDGGLWYPRIKTVTGTLTQAAIIARPGQPCISNRTYK